ncbi:MAG: bifunctional ADP-dependent NAD(P)H-hydrate dehydratase/NAD(P)H-hydrate epimerase, partial [Propionibacteriaceae bacterium]|nr:bifunctional ADP-dependent NAD(P)H-hydrate dehydratase/NAD(P)H-hydrate epimerase [Propionibacteriaceae bacterium]
MRAIHTAEQVRAAERAAGEELASGRLMAKAAAGLAREVAAELADRGRRVRGARLLLAVGPGDNGGDGLYAGAALAGRGARVDVWAAADRLHPGGWAAATAAGARPVDAAA